MMNSLLFILVIAAFVIVAGCSNDYCLNGDDDKIIVSVVENRDIITNSGFSNHHIVTVNITNIGETPAKSVTINTAYYNELKLGQRTCENRNINVGDIPPQTSVNKFFEYDRVIIQNQVDGNYQIEYKAKSCLPYTVVDNRVYVSQR